MSDMLITQGVGGRIDVLTSSDSPDRYEDQHGTCLVTGPRYHRVAAREVAMAWRQSPQAAARLDGHFVAMYYDKRMGTATVLRDKAGFGHVYHARTADGWMCSTSLSWLARRRQELGEDVRISRLGIGLYLAFQYIPTPYTPLESVHQLPAGSQLTLGGPDAPTVDRLVSYPAEAIAPAVDDLVTQAATVIEILRGEGAAREEHRDGKVGMLLSGGLDSSTNAAVYTEFLGLRPVGFTAQFAEAYYDETESARVIVDRYKIDHHVVPVAADALNSLEVLVTAFDSPNADQAIFAEWTVAKAAAEVGCRWMMTGEGGDEVLGYPQSHDGDLAVGELPLANDALAKYYFEKIYLTTGSLRNRLYDRLDVEEDLPYEILASVYRRHSTRSPFERVLFGQWATWLVDGVYPKDQGVFGALGIEPMMPFTNTRLMSYIAALPAEDKLRGLDNKRFLRTALGEVLPVKVLQKPKHKFWLPFETWFREDRAAATYLRDHLLCGGLVNELFGRELTERLLTEHAQSQSDHSRLLWALLFLELWYQQHASSWASMPS